MKFYCVNIFTGHKHGVPNVSSAIHEWLPAHGVRPENAGWIRWLDEEGNSISVYAVWLPQNDDELNVEFLLMFGEVAEESPWLKDKYVAMLSGLGGSQPTTKS